MNSSLQALLNQVTISRKALADAKRRIAPRYAPNFRLFDYMRRDEMSLSYCFATLLDPSAKHGQGSLYLELFCNQFLKNIEWTKSNNLRDAKVVTEHQTDTQRRIDLLIRLNSIGAIAIENKPWAADQNQQLTDYATYLEHREQNWILLYLCNNTPSKESITEEKRGKYEDANNFLQISFEQITDWLHKCLNQTRPPAVRIFIEELIKYITENINGVYDMDEQKEISNIILNNPDNLASALTIRSALDDVKKDLLDKLHNDLLSRINKKNGEHIEWQIDAKYETYSGFFLYSDKLDYYNLCFGLEFKNRGLNGCCWGLARSKEDIFLTTTDHDNAQKILPNPNSSSNKWWGWYSYDFSLLNLPSDSINWSASPAPWRAIYDGSLANKISELWKSAIKNAVAMSDKSITL